MHLELLSLIFFKLIHWAKALKVSLIFLTAISMMAVTSPSPEIGEKTAEITNAAWQGVPNTKGTTEGYPDPAYIDINSIKQQGDAVIFDVVNSDASYGRVEVNCSTNQIRSLRTGYFLSRIQVSYVEPRIDLWYEANPYQTKLLKFACEHSENNNIK